MRNLLSSREKVALLKVMLKKKKDICFFLRNIFIGGFLRSGQLLETGGKHPIMKNGKEDKTQDTVFFFFLIEI